MIPLFTRQRWLLLLGDIALILAATFLSPIIRFGHIFPIFDVHTGASTFTFLFYIILLYIFDLYHTGQEFVLRDKALRMSAALAIAGILSAFFFYSLPQWKYGRGIFLIQMVLVWTFLSCWRWLYSSIYSHTIEKENILILGAGHCGKTLITLLEHQASPYRVVGFLDDDPAKQRQVIASPAVLGTIDQLSDIAAKEKVNTAVLAITQERSHELMRRLLRFRFKGLTILDMPEVYERLTRRVPVGHIQDGWLTFASGFDLLSKDYIQKIKRLIDFGVSSLLLLITFPIMAFTALAIWLDSPGPVFYRQERIGKGNNIFTLWKFRSMNVNAEANGAVWAKKADSRVTRVGKWIRILRIDEIPQLFNVCKGEMSLIGPRPERPEFVQELKTKIPYYEIRHSVRPGITGWAQVNYHYGSSVEDALIKLEYEIYYIKNMSILLDIKILLKTIGVVLFGQGAR